MTVSYYSHGEGKASSPDSLINILGCDVPANVIDEEVESEKEGGESKIEGMRT